MPAEYPPSMARVLTSASPTLMNLGEEPSRCSNTRLVSPSLNPPMNPLMSPALNRVSAARARASVILEVLLSSLRTVSRISERLRATPVTRLSCWSLMEISESLMPALFTREKSPSVGLPMPMSSQSESICLGTLAMSPSRTCSLRDSLLMSDAGTCGGYMFPDAPMPVMWARILAMCTMPDTLNWSSSMTLTGAWWHQTVSS
ncbi:MAG: hypothetical protein BWX71_02491 [Deltaproteobacteria bacterium ADurb.Bin072]|nr:MAG: hypothetical protein BWX71_02491 [Deltaproteobacteria bacterium ADurb.Bin072]